MLAEGQMKKTYLILLLPLFLSNLFAREYIAIIDFKGLNISENDSKALTQRLTSEMIKLEIYLNDIIYSIKSSLIGLKTSIKIPSFLQIAPCKTCGGM